MGLSNTELQATGTYAYECASDDAEEEGKEVVKWSVEDIVRAINRAQQPNPVIGLGRFLLWFLPLAVALIIAGGHGRGDSYVPATRNESILAAALVLFGVGVLVKRSRSK